VYSNIILTFRMNIREIIHPGKLPDDFTIAGREKAPLLCAIPPEGCPALVIFSNSVLTDCSQADLVFPLPVNPS